MKAFNETIYTSEDLIATNGDFDKVKSDKKSSFRKGFEIGQEIDIKLTASEEGNVSTTGIITATSFVGDGSNLTGMVAPARLGTGTADSTTYLRGDGAWKNINVPLWFGTPANNDQTVPDVSTWTTVINLTDNAIDKSNGGWNASTGVFTCPVGDAGIYWVYGITAIDDIKGDDVVRTGFSKNGISPPVWAESRLGGSAYNDRTISSGMYSQVVSLAEGDTISMQTYHNENTGTGPVEFIRANRTNFGGYRLSA